MTITGEQDLGDLGPSKIEPVALSWALGRHLKALYYWAILLFLIVWKGQRDRQVWTVFCPMAVYMALAWSVQKALRPAYGSYEAISVARFASSMLFGWASVWVLSKSLEKGSGWRRGATAFAMLWGISVFGAACMARGNRSSVEDALAMNGASSLAILASVWAARWRSRGRLGFWRFTVWQLLALLLIGVVVVAPFDRFVIHGAIVGLTRALGMQGTPQGLIWVGIVFLLGSALGLACFVTVLPFTIFAFLLPGCLSRLRKILGEDA